MIKNQTTTMKFIQIALILALIPTPALSFELTQNQLQEAETTRAWAIKMGLHKATPKQMVDAAIEMAAQSETEARAPSKQEKKAMTCMMKQVLDMQFKSDLKEYARFLNDESYRVEINKGWEKNCKLNHSEP